MLSFYILMSWKNDLIAIELNARYIILFNVSILKKGLITLESD